MGKTEDSILDLVKQADPDNPVEYVTDIVRPLAVDKVKQTILSCKDCPCAQYGMHSIPYGDAKKASILVIGDSILEQQKNLGKTEIIPFEGTEEGEMLDKVWAAYHVKKDALFFMNAVNCYTADTVEDRILHRIPDTEEEKCCKNYLYYVIQSLQPLYIILLGNVVLNIFKKAKMEEERGKWMDVMGIPAMPTYSPTYLRTIAELKDADIVEEYKADFSEDLYQVFHRVMEDFPDDWQNILEEKLED